MQSVSSSLDSVMGYSEDIILGGECGCYREFHGQLLLGFEDTEENKLTLAPVFKTRGVW